jgi:hypothetical protein
MKKSIFKNVKNNNLTHMRHTSFFLVYCTFSILGHLTVIIQDSLEPPGHGMGQVHKVLLLQVSHPHPLDGRDQLWEEGGLKLLGLQLVFHEGPASQTG